MFLGSSISGKTFPFLINAMGKLFCWELPVVIQIGSNTFRGITDIHFQ